MGNILGPYYAPRHRKAVYFDWIRQLRPAWARIHQPSAGDIADVQGASPETLIMLRSWDIDDSNADRKREVAADPLGAARHHAQLWEQKLQSLLEAADRDGRTVDPSKWYIGLINEPNKDILPQIVQYTEERLRISVQDGYPLGVGVSSVGNFPKPGEHPHSWDLFKPLEAAINDTGSVLVAHEYWLPEGPDFVWIDDQGRERHEAGNTAWRHHSIPLDVRIVIGEAGANGYMWNRHTSKDDGGWQNYRNLGLDAAGYAVQVRQYIEGCDTRVEGVLLFMLGHHTKQWKSFDIEPALSELLEIRDARPEVESPFTDTADDEDHTVFAPTVTTGKPRTVYAKASAGLWVRREPSTDADTITKLPYGVDVQVTESRDGWLRMFGWIHSAWVSDTDPDPLPTVVDPEPQPVEPVPSGIIDPYVGQAILAVESGGQGFGPGGRLLIRFEAHLFNRHTQHAHAHLFRHGTPAWQNQEWRRSESEAWRPVHGNQATVWQAFEFASTLNREAALKSTSLGAPQILGSHYRRLGYASAEAMFQAFADRQYGLTAQMLGFLNFVLSDAKLFLAMRNKDFRSVAAIYNGPGNIDSASAKYRAAYEGFR